MNRFIAFAALPLTLFLGACTATIPGIDTNTDSSLSTLTKSEMTGSIEATTESGSTIDQSATGDMLDTASADDMTGYENPNDNARD